MNRVGEYIRFAIWLMRLGRKAPQRPRRYVRPRSHFGLRNAPH
jgi:hypothetical protein